MTPADRAPAAPSAALHTRARVGTAAGLMLPAGLAVALIGIPLVALLVRADCSGLPGHLAAAQTWPAIRLSLLTSTCALAVSVVLGTPLAFLLARTTNRYAAWLRALVTVPLVLPPVVGGVALLLAWGRRGVVGAPLFEVFGWQLPFTPAAVVLSQVFVAMPFLVVSVEGAIRTVDPRYDAMAATLGASRWRTFCTVAVPLALPGLVSGAALAWARALGEFGATITFAGNFTGRTQTAPLAVYVALEDDPQAAIALSLLMLAVSVLVLVALRGRWTR